MDQELIFEINNQVIKRIDHFHPVEGSKNYLGARFIFNTPEWEKVVKRAVFRNDEECIKVDIIDGCCQVPESLIKPNGFEVSAYGTDGGVLITVSIVFVRVYEK